MPMNEAIVDFQPVGVVDTPAGPRQRVVVVAVRREMIERILAATTRGRADRRGRRPERLRHGPRARRRHGAGAQLFVNVAGLTNVAVANDAGCLFTRAAAGGLDSMVQTLAERRGLTVEHATQWLRHVGLVTPLEELEGDPELLAATRAVLDEGVPPARRHRPQLAELLPHAGPLRARRAAASSPARPSPSPASWSSSPSCCACPLESGVVGTGRRPLDVGAADRRRRPRGHRAPVARAGERGRSPNLGPMSVAAGAVLAGVLGAVFGSFLNVVAHRLPRGESVVKPRSRCPGCGTRDPAVRQHPGALVAAAARALPLRAASRSARATRSWRPARPCCAPPWWSPRALEWEALLGIVFVLLLVPITLIDLDTFMIPNKLTGPGALLAIAIVAVFAPDQLPEHLIAAAGGRRLPVPRVALLSRRDGDGRRQARGHDGPVPRAAPSAPAMFAGLIAGALVGALIMARLGVAEGRKTEIPFGPYLAFGGLVGLFAGDAIVDWYLDSFA